MVGMTTLPVSPEHVDVLIVGAGISGIGAARHLEHRLPGTSYVLLEARDALGGTWDLFRFPGIRSDSDLHTFGYAFKPWTQDEAIADGDAILRYIGETAAERGIDRHIRFGHRVVRAAWSSDEARWTVDVELAGTGETTRMTAGWLFSASGYYRYDEGYSPEFAGRERFSGPIIHPQHWPQELDYAGKRVVVIGSGATAVTLVPALAEQAAHVTMLQRSPSYILALPSRDGLANRLRALIGERRAYAFTRRKNIRRQAVVYALSRRFPNAVRRVIRALTARQLPEGYAVDTHFKPRYDPWDQRLCLVPDGDLFKALGRGDASVVTDAIETFTERGVRLASGAELEADVIVTATGLNLLAFGGVELEVDGRAVALPETLAYKGAMLSGVPNFAFAVGYTNASWTLKVDLVCAWLCRVLAHMRAGGFDTCVAEAPEPPVETRPLLNFSAGYVLRSLDAFPRQGTEAPWQLPMSYAEDVRRLRDGAIDDGTLRFAAANRLAPA
jgi:monooxygenase